MSTRSFSSSSGSSIEFEGGDGQSIITDYFSDEMIATVSNYSALNNLRILVVKALIDIFVEGLSFDEQSKKKLRDGILQTLHRVDIVPSNYNLPIITEVTNQIRQNLEKMIVKSLKATHATNDNPEVGELALQALESSNGKISMDFCWEKICMPSRYRDDFEEVEQLGKGGFGSVFKAKKKSDGSFYAVKKMELRGNNQTVNFIGEVQQMVRLSHPNIVRFFTSWTELDPFHKMDKDENDDDDDDDDFTATSSRTDLSNVLSVWNNGVKGLPDIFLYIQMELCNEDLSAWLFRRNSDKVSKSCDNKEMVKQILKGVQYLHDSQVLHRDLKPQNILINWSSSPSNFIVKITDFGLSRVLNTEHCIIQNFEEKDVDPNESQELTVGVGTVPYISPEQKENSNYDFKSDIYCVGLMAYEIFWPMYTGSEKLANFEKLGRSIVCEEFENENKTMSDFVLWLTKRTPQERPTATQALSHSCLEGSISPVDISDLMARMKSLEERLKKAESENSKLKVKLSSCSCSRS